jgi:hypothetical protein
MKFSWAISRVKWLNSEKTYISKTISVFVLRIHISTLRTRTEIVFETLVFSPFNHLTWLIAQENFIIKYTGLMCPPVP